MTSEISADENISEENETVQDSGQQLNAPKNRKKSGKKITDRIGAPLCIAFSVFLATILFFGAWKCFFDTSIIGSWTFHIENDDYQYTYNLTFEDDNVVKYHFGGRTYIGRYNFVDGVPRVHVFIASNGQTFIDVYFDYEFSGNLFTGRKLILTDRTGLMFTPDELTDENKNSDLFKSKNEVAESVDDDGIRYYKLVFENYSIEPEIQKYDDFQEDKDLTGIWLYEDDSSAYAYTYTFTSDGVFEQMSEEIDMIGGYKAKDGVLTFNFVAAKSSTADYTGEYSVDGDTLTLNGSYQLKRVDDQYAYQKDIK